MTSVLACLLVAGSLWLAGCGGGDPAPYALGPGGGMRDAGDDPGPGGEGGNDPGTGGQGGSSGQGGGGTGGAMGMDSGTPDPDAGGTPTPIVVPDSPANPWIAFVTIDTSGFGQLFFVKADGTGLAEYGGDTFFENDPAWSPDGTQLAFTGLNDTSGATELHILDFTANTDTVLDTGLAAQSRPRWSADGTKIVVAGGEQATDTSTLFRVDVATGDSAAITEPTDGDGGHDVGADGRVYFVRKSGDVFDVFSVALSATPTTTAARITMGSDILGGVAVSPDATKLLFSREAGMTTDLVEHTIEGGGQRTIGDPGDEQADYFAGGDGIVVNRDSFDADSEIAVTNADGVLTTKCTDDPESNTSPAIGSAESSAVDISTLAP